MSDTLAYYQALTSLLEQEVPCVQVTLAEALGSAPQQPGAKMLVTEQGLYFGTVGGGKLETHCIRTAQALLQGEDRQAVQCWEWNLQRDIGMTCGGVVRMLFEVHHPLAWTVAVFGAGHVAQALIPLLATLQCQVRCFDSRPEWIARLPVAPRLKAEACADLGAQVATLPAHTFILSMTMGHAHDLPVLKAVFQRRREDPDAFPFVGVIGSHSKAGVLRRDLQKAEFTPEEVASFYCPVGLPLGNNTPPEIALSMVAQLLQERDHLLAGHPKWHKANKQIPPRA